MKRRSLILMIAIVLLPIALLTWFGVRMARDEQTLVQQRYRSLMEQRLQDVNRSIAQRFDETERRLQQITSVSDFDVTELRAVVRREPQVTQLFVLSPEGELLYPNPAEPLNGTEQSFLRQASRMFTTVICKMRWHSPKRERWNKRYCLGTAPLRLEVLATQPANSRNHRRSHGVVTICRSLLAVADYLIPVRLPRNGQSRCWRSPE